jgi:Holliday junction resolvasome RuvABC endonuclease subunit
MDAAETDAQDLHDKRIARQKRERREKERLAGVEQSLIALLQTYRANLATLEEMKASRNLTSDWGESSLISVRGFVEHLEAALGCDHIPMKAALDDSFGCIRCGKQLKAQ